jgi:hypothetical protein
MLRSQFGQVTPIEMVATLSDPDPATYGRRILPLAAGRARSSAEMRRPGRISSLCFGDGRS